MARTTVRVDFPVGSPDQFLALCESVLKQHDTLAADSEVPADLADDLRPVVAVAKPAREKADALTREAQGLNEGAAKKLGIAPGQTLRTEGTALNLLARIRDMLLAKHMGSENALEAYGFNVVVGTAAGPTKKAAVK